MHKRCHDLICSTMPRFVSGAERYDETFVSLVAVCAEN